MYMSTGDDPVSIISHPLLTEPWHPWLLQKSSTSTIRTINCFQWIIQQAPAMKPTASTARKIFAAHHYVCSCHRDFSIIEQCRVAFVCRKCQFELCGFYAFVCVCQRLLNISLAFYSSATWRCRSRVLNDYSHFTKHLKLDALTVTFPIISYDVFLSEKALLTFCSPAYYKQLLTLQKIKCPK